MLNEERQTVAECFHPPLGRKKTDRLQWTEISAHQRYWQQTAKARSHLLRLTDLARELENLCTMVTAGFFE